MSWDQQNCYRTRAGSSRNHVPTSSHVRRRQSGIGDVPSPTRPPTPTPAIGPPVHYPSSCTHPDEPRHLGR